MAAAASRSKDGDGKEWPMDMDNSFSRHSFLTDTSARNREGTQWTAGGLSPLSLFPLPFSFPKIWEEEEEEEREK